MHSCSEPPTKSAREDKDCLSLLTSTYAFIHRIGDKETVTASVVFKLSQETQDVAVKVMPLDDAAVNDVRIACLLNGMSEQTPIFVRTFGWIKCQTIPWQYKNAPRAFNQKKKNAMYLFQVMAFSSHAWTDARIELSMEEYRTMLFLLMHGLWIAREKTGFRHNDIHQGQVLFQTCKPGTPITVTMGENSYTIKCERFVPKLIDFGLASTGEQEKEDFSSDSDDMFEKEQGTIDDDDIRNLVYMFEERMKQDGLEPFLLRYTTMDEILMRDPIFDNIRKGPRQPVNSRLCDVCSSVAKHAWGGCDIVFCGESCASSWKHIGRFIF